MEQESEIEMTLAHGLVAMDKTDSIATPFAGTLGKVSHKLVLLVLAGDPLTMVTFDSTILIAGHSNLELVAFDSCV